MTLYLIGLGLNEKSISVEAFEKIKNSDEVYLENYTVDFPYKIEDLEKEIHRKIILLGRENVEDESIVKEAKNKDVVLLIYGDPLSATTHTQLILACKKQKIKFKIFHNASILTAVGETGLQLYNFGKTTSLPKWIPEKFEPTSFVETIKQNQKINSHTIILVDIGLELKDAILQVKKATFSQNLKLPEKIILISNAGTEKQKLFYENLENFPEKIQKPYAFVIPSQKLNFAEEEFLESI